MARSLTVKFMSFALLPIAAVMLLPRPGNATPMSFVVNLSGANEIPVNPSPATGQATVVLDPVANTLQLNVTFSDLVTPDVAAHIHCCLPSPFSPANVPVATAVPAFPGFPLMVTSGSYISPVFDLTQPTIYNPAFVMSSGGLPQAEAALVAGILAGETYLNIHTVSSPGGEIRGFLVPAAAVPEPASVSLLLLGSALFCGVRLRQRRRETKKSYPGASNHRA